MATATTTSEDDKRNHSDTGDQSYSRRHSNHEREKLNRNTLNQRASRARRKDYVNSLESKVREYEAQGVQATEEVQNAARRVAEENRVLKEEMRMLREHVRCLEEVLGRKGSRVALAQSGLERGGHDGALVEDTRRGDVDMDAMRQLELDSAWKRLQHEDRVRRREQFGLPQQQGHVSDQSRWPDQRNPSRSSLPNIDDMPGETAAVQYPSPPGDGEANGKRRHRQHGPAVTMHHHLRPVDEPEFPHSGLSSFNAYHDAETDEDTEQHINHHDSENPSHVYSPYSEVWTQQSYNAPTNSHARDQYTRPQHNIPSSSSSSSRSVLPANTTPCEEAALIIASMRGIGHANPTYQAEILPELGCDSTNATRSCSVDNARLFRIMDSDRV